MTLIRGGRKYALTRTASYLGSGVVLLYFITCLINPTLAPHFTTSLAAYFGFMGLIHVGHSAANATEAVKLGPKTTVRTEETTVQGAG